MGTLNGHAARIRGAGGNLSDRADDAEQRARIAKARAETEIAKLKGRAARSIARASGPVGWNGGYANAYNSRLRPDAWGRARGGSADSHRQPVTLQILRRQCQDLDRNNVIARGLVQRQIDMVLGSGFSVSALSGDAAWNKKAESLFNAWAGVSSASAASEYDPGECDIRGRWCVHDFAAEGLRSAAFEGDMGIVLTLRGQLQAVEAERIRGPQGLGPVNTRTMAGGVEMDGSGRPIAYHIAEWQNTEFVPEFKTRAVPAENFVLLANPLRDITGSTRGEPQLAASLDRFDHLAGFEETVRVAARAHAALAMFVKSSRPDLAEMAWTGTTETNRDGNQERELDLEPLTIKFLRPNEEIQAFQPTQPGPNVEQFVLLQVMLIGADLALPLPLAMLDGRQVNLSSIRSVMQFAWRNFRRLQEWLKRAFYSRVYRWRIAMFIREGLLEYRDDWAAHDFTPPPPPVMDPKIEIEAARMKVDARLGSYKQAIQQLDGRDRDRVWDELEEELEELSERKIEPIASPGAAAATTGKGEGPPQPPAPDETGGSVKEDAGAEPGEAAESGGS